MNLAATFGAYANIKSSPRPPKSNPKTSKKSPHPSSVDPRHVFTGNFAPVHELPPTECHLAEGALPASLNGVYIRNGPNPQHLDKIKGPLHFFEGDGMLHSLKISDGRATYCCRHVETYRYLLEKERGSPLFPNFLSGLYSLDDVVSWMGAAVWKLLTGEIDLGKGYGLANTSVALFGKRIVALCESDMPYTVSVTKDGDVRTLGRWDFDKGLFANMTAHPKVDPVTGEGFAFRCSLGNYPYLTYFRFNGDGTKQPDVPILSSDRSTFIHDFAITGRYAIFAESQLLIEPAQLLAGKGIPVVCNPTRIPRIGVLPRYATTDSEMKWFRVPGFNPLHVLNAWDTHEGEEIIFLAPNVFNIMNIFHQPEAVHYSLEKVTLNLKTGEVVSRRAMSNRSLEFGAINPSFVGKATRYAYYGLAEKVPKTVGVVKIDLGDGCEVGRRVFGPGQFGGEPIFMPATGDRGGEDEEDNGFVATYVHDESSGESRFVVMDARSPELDVVAAVRMPRRVPYGVHGLFIKDKDLSAFFV